MSETENIVDQEVEKPVSQRLLLSLKEAAKIIGTKGLRIQKIREDNNVTIGISERRARCSDRILTCSGNIENVSNSIGDIARILNNSNDDNENEGESVEEDVNERFTYPFLNFRLPKPTVEEIKENPDKLKDIVNIRILATKSQCSAIIGTKGDRIKSYIERFGVKMVVSNDPLPDSDERILEIQGFPNSITIVLVEVNTLIKNEVPFNSNEVSYVPHTSVQTSDVAQPIRAPRRPVRHFEEEFKIIVKIPEAYVGAVVGRQGNRIANLRKFSKTKIVIEKRADEITQDTERVFEIISNDMKNVKVAETMLKRNLAAEIQRRAEQAEEVLEILESAED